MPSSSIPSTYPACLSAATCILACLLPYRSGGAGISNADGGVAISLLVSAEGEPLLCLRQQVNYYSHQYLSGWFGKHRGLLVDGRRGWACWDRQPCAGWLAWQGMRAVPPCGRLEDERRKEAGRRTEEKEGREEKKGKRKEEGGERAGKAGRGMGHSAHR